MILPLGGFRLNLPPYQNNVADAIAFLTPFLLREGERDKMIARDDGDDKIRERDGRRAGLVGDKASVVCDHH